MWIKRFLYLLFFLGFVPSFLCGQTIDFSGKTGSGTEVNRSIKVNLFVVYTDGTEVALANFGNVIPIFKTGDAQLLIKLEEETKKVQKVTIKTTGSGAFGNSESTKIKFRNNGQGKNHIPIPIIKHGQGNIALEVIEVQFKSDFIFEKSSTYRQQIEVASIIDLVNKKTDLCNKINLPRYAKAAEQCLKLKPYSTIPNYRKTQDYYRVVEDRIMVCFKELEQAASTNPSRSTALALFEVFGQKELNNYTLTKRTGYLGKATNAIKNIEKTVWSGLNSNSILEIEATHQSFCDAIKGYKCSTSTRDRDTKIKVLIEKNKDDCTFWQEQIEPSNYYDAHQNDALIKTIKENCTKEVVVVDCESLLKAGKRSSNVVYINRQIEKLKSQNCGQAYIQKLNSHKQSIGCQSILNRALAEPEPLERRSLLNQVIDNKTCSENIKKQAREAKLAIPLIKIGGFTFKGTSSIAERKQTGRGVEYIYEVIFEKGIGIQIDSIDNTTDSLELLQLANWKWIAADSILEIRLKDGGNHAIVFRSNLDETDKMILTKEVFQATIAPTDELLVINVENGIPNYYARFTNAQTSFDVPINAPQHTINLAELQQLGGNYTVQIVDNNGTKGLKTPIQITLKKPWQPDLWMILALPIALLGGFLTYRNWGTETTA